MLTKSQEIDLYFTRVISIKRIFTPIFIDSIQYPTATGKFMHNMVYIFGVRVFCKNMALTIKE